MTPKLSVHILLVFSLATWLHRHSRLVHDGDSTFGGQHNAADKSTKGGRPGTQDKGIRSVLKQK